MIITFNVFRYSFSWYPHIHWPADCEPGNATSVPLLAAHLYYRSLLTIPSLVRSWVLECKDRQLYMTVVSYTSQHFSQVLTQAELAHVKSPESMAELTDEHMTVKVANSVNEVTASYLVDEHQLEITLKLPPDWPLHPIEVKDTKKIGVLENRWRAWVLGVQQTIWAHVSWTSCTMLEISLNSSRAEWPCCGWPESVQEECYSSF